MGNSSTSWTIKKFCTPPGKISLLKKVSVTMTNIRKVTVLGTGVLGSQIAFQTSYCGFEVTSYDINDEALAAARKRFEGLAVAYRADNYPGAEEGQADANVEKIKLTTDLAEAVADADLVIEAVPEVPAIKTETYTKLAAVAPEKTIFATNSSTLLPSSFMDATGRPEKFLALHFANHIWKQNTAEVMGTEKTDQAVYDTVVEFAEEIKMVPIKVLKEQPGYVLNSLLVPFLDAAAALYVKGVAEPETIDTTWRLGTGAPRGPFEIFDIVGLKTAYNISKANPDELAQQFAKVLDEEFISKGKLGAQSGEGFYKYNN